MIHIGICIMWNSVWKGDIQCQVKIFKLSIPKDLNLYEYAPLPIFSLSLWPLVNLFWLTRQQGAWGLQPQGLGGEMSGSLHTSGEAPQGTATQISLPRQHSMVWHMRNKSASESAFWQISAGCSIFLYMIKSVNVTLGSWWWWQQLESDLEFYYNRRKCCTGKLWEWYKYTAPLPTW